MIKHLNDENFSEALKEKKVLVDFFATWCGPCKMLGTVIERFASKSDVKVVKVDVDEASLTAGKYGIMSVPTLIIFKNGKEVKRTSGFMPLEALEKWVMEDE